MIITNFRNLGWKAIIDSFDKFNMEAKYGNSKEENSKISN